VAEGIVRKIKRALTLPVPRDDVPRHLALLAADARVFGALHEGQRVRYQADGGGFDHGTLVEKCRFGALVLRADQAVVGVGFRRVGPAVETAN
jgi:hypothetical protein